MKDARILQALWRVSEVGLVLFLTMLLSGCRSGSDRVNLIVRAGSQNPGAAPGPVGHTDVAVLQILLLAGESSIDVTGLRLHASGTGDDALGIGEVRLFRDQTGDGVLDAGDTLLVAAGGFSSDDGAVLLSGFREPISRTAPVYWLIVYGLAPGASAGETFCPSVIDRSDVQAERSGQPTDDIDVSQGIVGCMTASPGELTLSPGPDSPPPRTLGPCVTSEVILQIDLAASPIEGVRVDSIAFTASGSGDDAASIDGVTLAIDANDNGIFDGFDIPIASTSGYPADDGTIIFPSLNRLLPAGSAERWILVYDLIWPFSMGDSFAASVGAPSDVVAIGDSTGNSLGVLGTPVDGGLVSMEQIRILSARFEDTNASGIADQGDRILLTMSHDVMLQSPRFADDIFSVLPGTLGRARIGTGPSLQELEIVLESAHDIAPHGTAGIDPGSSGMNVWLGQTELLDCQGLPVLPATSEIDLTGDLRPRVVLAGISDVNGNCVVDASDTLDITFTTRVTVTTADPDQAFVLPVSGDSFGTAPRFIGGGAPTNVMRVSIVLGAGSVLTSTGAFDPVSLSAGSPSGLDVTAIAGVVVDAQYAGISALPNATAAIDVTDAPLWESVGDDWMDADFGWSVAWAGDVDGNTYPDIIVGAPRFTGLSIDHGKAYVYLGGPAGLATSPSWTSVGDGQAGALYGFSVASAGDVNNDTYPDIIVGAPGFDGGSPGTGKVYVYLGGPGGL
ncbi:MAG: integrin alpha, partial [Planctomycetota bacterium]|nr:integrin alpha [Planctomycetota bacterium]